MLSALVIIIGLIGAIITIAAVWRLLVAIRSGAPRQLQVGLLAIMLAASVLSTVMVRLIGSVA